MVSASQLMHALTIHLLTFPRVGGEACKSTWAFGSALCAYAMSHSEASRLLPEAGACGLALPDKALPLLGRGQALQRSPGSVQNAMSLMQGFKPFHNFTKRRLYRPQALAKRDAWALARKRWDHLEPGQCCHLDEMLCCMNPWTDVLGW